MEIMGLENYHETAGRTSWNRTEKFTRSSSLSTEICSHQLRMMRFFYTQKFSITGSQIISAALVLMLIDRKSNER